MRYALFVYVVFGSFSILAQQTDSTSVVQLESVVNIAASRLESRPAFHLIEKASLHINDGLAAHNVLNQVPGVFMHSGTLNTNRITIRGIGNRSPFGTSKIRAYLNEIPLTSGIGETALEDIDLDLIDEIEIWKGPTASRYGAGLGGMIHYKSNRRIPGINTRVTVGSFGMLRSTEEIVVNTNEDALQLRINHNFTRVDGWRENSEYQRQGIALLADYKGQKASWHLLVNTIDLFGQIPSSLNATDFENDPAKAAFNWNQVKGFEEYQKIQSGIAYQSHWDQNWQLTSSVSYFGKNGYESRPFNILEDGNNTLNHRTAFTRKMKRLTIKSGWELFHERYIWETFETDLGTQGASLDQLNELRTYANLFGEFNYSPTERWSIESGFNLNKTHYKLDDPATQKDYSFEWTISPNLNVVYTPSNLHNYFFTLSHGFSTPTFEETLNPEGGVNDAIGPETGWNFELGTRGAALSQRLSYDLSIYHMRVKDLLVARSFPDLVTGFDQIISVNAGRTRQQGLDAAIDFSLIRKESTFLNWSVTYSFQDFKFLEFIDDENDYSLNELTGSIPHRVNSLLHYQIEGFGLGLQYQFVSAMPMRDDNSIYSDEYSLVNFKSSYNMAINPQVNLRFELGVNNLFDEHYASMILINAGSFGPNLPRYYYPGSAVNWYGSVKLNWRFN